MRRLTLLTGLLAIALLAMPVLHGNAATTDPATACMAQIGGRVLQQQRVFRQILFGRRPAALELTGATRFDTTGTPWIKIGAGRWVTALSDRSRSDGQVDANTEWEGMNDPGADTVYRTDRSGIFETKGALTSDLIPSALEAYRAFRCRLAMVCGGLDVNRNGGSAVAVSTAGWI